MTVTEPAPAIAAAEDPDGLAAELAFAADRLARGLHAVPPPGLSVSEMAVLSDLAGGLTSPAALGAREQMKPPSVTRHIRELGERGLISRAAHGDDARRAVLTVTGEGHRELDAARRGMWLAACVRNLDDADQQALRDVLAVLARLFPHPVPAEAEPEGPIPGQRLRVHAGGALPADGDATAPGSSG